MRHYIAKFSSEGNIGEGEIYISAKNIEQAQDKFFDYIKLTSMYSHMWQLSVRIREIDGAV